MVCSCPLFSPLQLQSSYIYEVSTRAVKKGRGAGEYDHWINSSDTRELSVRWSGAEAPHPHARTSARTTGGNAINNSRPGSGWRNDLCTPQPISCRLGSWIAAMSGAPRATVILQSLLDALREAGPSLIRIAVSRHQRNDSPRIKALGGCPHELCM